MKLEKLCPIIMALVLIQMNVFEILSLILHYSEEHLNEDQLVDQNSFIVCHCNGRTRTELLSNGSLEHVFQSIQNRNFCGYNDSTSVCKLLKECNNCSAEMENCTPIKGGGYDCIKKRIEMRDRYFINLNTYDGSTAVLRRNRRQLRTCHHPLEMRTSELSIKKYPSSIVAKQKCLYGYTLKEGITKEIRCKHKENKWTPTGFEECQPFIDCHIFLTSPGRARCSVATTWKAPSCNVSCEPYELTDGVPEATYECQITGEWKPKLPYCVGTGSGIELVPAPQIKLHPIEAENKARTLKENLKAPKKV